jgi:MFS family permease
LLVFEFHSSFVSFHGHRSSAAAGSYAVSKRQIHESQINSSIQSTLFISALNTTIVATAIPTITSDLHSAAGYSWIGGAYVIANTAASPVWVKLSDIWGRKPILLAGVGLYFGASILCAAARNIVMLIVGRALQGAAGAGVGQLVNVVISDMFSMRSVLVLTYFV